MDEKEPIVNDPYVVNGRRYSLWPQIVEQKDQYIGGTLIDLDGAPSTEITDITFIPNGEDSAMFTIHGKDYDCSCDVKYLGVAPELGGNGWLGFSSRFGTGFKIKIKNR